MSTAALIKSALLFLSLILVAVPFVLVVLYHHITTKPARHHRTAIILVLGDVGRSPRMMYHAESFARHGWEAIVVGYGDTAPIPPLLELPHVHLRYLVNPPWPLLRLPWILRAPIRILYQVLSVLYITLVRLPIRCELLLVQNPPTIPTLALAQFISYLTGAKLIIDWHNTGYSILAMRTGEQSPLVRVAKWFEGHFGQKAWAHLFVTKAMEEFLVKDFALEGHKVVLHDRPPPHFRRTEPILMHDLLHRLLRDLQPPIPPSFCRPEEASTPLTYVPPHPPGFPTHAPLRPALLVSSTSWTADEDFSLLLTALDMYQAAFDLRPGRLPRLIVLITGKGALRAPFERAVREREYTVGEAEAEAKAETAETPGETAPLGEGEAGTLGGEDKGKDGREDREEGEDRGKDGREAREEGPSRRERGSGNARWTDIIVRCLFVSAKDYPTLLGSADLGVSLHSSSSGRDLPMKVVDMFGCGVPVLARGFLAIDELVKDGQNGRVFESAVELGDQLVDTLANFPQAEKLIALQAYFQRQPASASPPRRLGSTHEVDEWCNWQENWDQVVHRGLLSRTS